ncbi:hypothetical protein [Virgisporangium aurantiacum]|uniref:Uncharacterized protein n=1 Tax=Virgisporangium aurantiacum TaxID=175570 RepID=A0A8J4E652_9ACTN|nr:hypothetical protein [Virgisporangium aurantiacum]GIJ63056.1 hypothetical protein Vau01_105720 [Virgisporangium aurantiacum]
MWIAEPGLTHRLLTQVPDPVSLGDLTGLPEWCVYLIAANPTDGDGADIDTVAASAGLWIHLEHDINTGRPELRLLIDPGAGIGDMTALPVYLDRDTVTEALTDMVATARATLDNSGILPGLDVRAAAPTAEAATPRRPGRRIPRHRPLPVPPRS